MLVSLCQPRPNPWIGGRGIDGCPDGLVVRFLLTVVGTLTLTDLAVQRPELIEDVDAIGEQDGK